MRTHKVDIMNELSPQASSEFDSSLKLFLHYISQDNLSGMLSVLNGVESSHRQCLLNGRFRSADHIIKQPASVWECENLVQQLSVEYPLSVAIVYRSINCFKALVENGCDLFLQDYRGNSVVHLLVYVSVAKADNHAVEMYDFILSRLNTVKERRQLLSHRSDDGLLAMDLAAKHGCVKLFRAILYTEGYYRAVTSQQGSIVVNSFSFGGDDTSCMSFLWQLTWTEDTEKNSEAVNELLKIPVVSNMIHQRFYAALPYVCFWMLMRCMHGILFLIIDTKLYSLYFTYNCNSDGTLNFNESTDISYSDWLTKHLFLDGPLPAELVAQSMYGITYAVCTIMFDIAEIIYLIKNSKMINRSYVVKLLGDYLVNTNFYRAVTLMFAISCIIQTMTQLVSPLKHIGITSDILAMITLLNRILVTFSVLYFIQLLPMIGFFVIGFQKMLAALARFSLLQGVIIFVFSTLFEHVHMYLCKPSIYTCNSRQSIYVTFLIMLNMVTVVEAGQCSYLGDICLQLLHILYVFVVAVMTINYLIAIMSSVYNIFAFQENSAVLLHRVHIFLTLERRLKMIQRYIPKLCPSDPNKKIIIREIDKDFDEMQHIRLEAGPFGKQCDLQMQT